MSVFCLLLLLLLWKIFFSWTNNVKCFLFFIIFLPLYHHHWFSYPLAKFYTFFYHHHEWSFTTPCVLLGPYMEAKDIKTRKEGWRKWDEHTSLQIWIFIANVVWSCKKSLEKYKRFKNLFKEERKNSNVFLLHYNLLSTSHRFIIIIIIPIRSWPS